MEDIDQNQFQPNNTNSKHLELQGNNVARNEFISNGEDHPKHSLSTYTDDENRRLLTAANEDWSKGTCSKIQKRVRYECWW